MDSISRRLAKIEWELVDADPILKIRLIQERMNLKSELADKKSVQDQKKLEDQFVQIALKFSDQHQICYQAWREFGVEHQVLSRAGILAPERSNSISRKSDTALT